jgi:hypothetical protein
MIQKAGIKNQLPTVSALLIEKRLENLRLAVI